MPLSRHDKSLLVFILLLFGIATIAFLFTAEIAKSNPCPDSKPVYVDGEQVGCTGDKTRYRGSIN